MAYPPIEDHGIIGNMRTAALVGMNGSIDWFCAPRFDSPSIFGALLDQNGGGCFKIAPTVEGFSQKQYYWPDTNVLITHFSSAEGAVEITDFMPMGEAKEREACPLIRRVKVTRGSVPMGLDCRPAFNYGRDPHSVTIDPCGAIFKSGTLTLSLSSTLALGEQRQGAGAEFTLNEGESQSFRIRIAEPGDEKVSEFSEAEAGDLLRDTLDYWSAWIAKCTYAGRWRGMVKRSALALELLVYGPTGAILGAATTSLPEEIGGERNWDYRCSWIRDSAFTVYALLRVGLTDEADRFMSWVESRCNEIEPSGSLRTVYAIDGRQVRAEAELSHWEGYRGSRPVRIGNAAADQLQMDIYGELLDAVYLYNKYGTPISSAFWMDLRKLLDWVCDNWQRKDSGIWEVRSGPNHFVYSKLMCWVALDRGLRIAIKRSFPADLNRWLKIRDQIYTEILGQGWDLSLGAFVQSYGSRSLDASSLMMPLVFFMSFSDPKMLSTIDAICRPVSDGGLLSDGMVYRYNNRDTKDGISGAEGTFNMCGFWLVEALTRAGRAEPHRLPQARLLFQQMLGRANHVGLYSEECGLRGEALGNIPQAFTHLALISAAANLDRAERGETSIPWEQSSEG
ncbi:MAG TPA: glycoside hydrolase family 15 protein [Terriglobia bacterium]|nr:glycoside hydrolase family 15 protein [Terriglobia bacterium]